MRAAHTRVADEVDDAVDAHHLECVDLVADAHGAELGGEAGADLRGQRHPGHQRGDLTGVGQRRDHAGERLGADLLQAVEALEADLGAGEEGDRDDHEEHAAADDERARPRGRCPTSGRGFPWGTAGHGEGPARCGRRTAAGRPASRRRRARRRRCRRPSPRTSCRRMPSCRGTRPCRAPGERCVDRHQMPFWGMKLK